MKFTDQPRPTLQEATARVLEAVQPAIDVHDLPAALSAIATVFGVLLAGQAFVDFDDLDEQRKYIANSSKDFCESVEILALQHLDDIREHGKGGTA